jgi:ABC-type uncharacterized transport system auxiliary subunit
VKTAASWWNVCKAESAKGLLLACGLAALGLAVSCGGIPKTYYYTLRAPAPPAASDPQTGFTLGIEHFRAPEMLRDDRIVYFQSPTEVNFYEYHRWSADPATLLTEYTAQWINNAGVFSQVVIFPVQQPVDYILRGRVAHFEEVDYEAGGKARVSLELTLVRARDRKAIWSGRNTAEAPFAGKGMEGVAAGVNAATERLVREMLPGMVAQVEQDYRATSGQSQ